MTPVTPATPPAIPVTILHVRRQGGAYIVAVRVRSADLGDLDFDRLVCSPPNTPGAPWSIRPPGDRQLPIYRFRRRVRDAISAALDDYFGERA